MLQERNQTCRHRSNLLRRHINKVDRIWPDNRIISILTALDRFTDERTVIVQRRIALSDNLVFLLFRCQENDILVVHIHLGILHTAVRGHDEAEVVDLGIHTKRRDQSDVRTFRRLDRAQTAIVGIVDITHLESSTFTRQTAGAQGGETTLVGDLSQRVRLVHELAQRIGTEERVDDA